jgi:hypothetical protein
MIRHNTVFVLGAGASYPYGFPTERGWLARSLRSPAKSERETPFSIMAA